jgi:glycosyltransferase involved in cell wall biosynthesis
MTKALFVHSHRFTKSGDNYYSSDSFPKTVWSRYLEVFDEIVVLGRKDLTPNPDISNFSLTSRDKVSFELIDYLESPVSGYIYKKRVIRDIKAIIEKHNINAVIARLPSNISNRAIDVCKELSIPYAIEVVGCGYDAIYNYKFSPWYNIKNLGVKLLAPFSFKSMQFYVKDAKFAIYVTTSFLQNRYPVGRSALSVGISDVELPSFDDEIIEKHLSLLTTKRDYLSFGMIGNVDVHYKGYDIALKALSLIKDKIPNFNLHLVGGGVGDDVKRLANELGILDKIVFVGKLRSGDEVFNFLDTLDVYLHPSRTEGLPRALVEAMGRGCPCLASNVGGIPELLENEYLHKAEDYKTLSKQILKLVSSKDKLTKAAQTNFDKAKEYSVDVLSQRRNQFWGSFYQYVVKQKLK